MRCASLHRYFQRIVNASAEGVSQFQDGGFEEHGTISAPGVPDEDDEDEDEEDRVGHNRTITGQIWLHQPPDGCEGYAPNSVDCTGDICTVAKGNVSETWRDRAKPRVRVRPRRGCAMRRGHMLPRSHRLSERALKPCCRCGCCDACARLRPSPS